MKQALEELMKVKVIHESKAANELNKSKQLLAQAEQEVAKAEKTAEEFHQWRLRRLEEMDAEIIKHEVQVKDIDDYRANAAEMQQEELALYRAIDEAKKNREQAVQDLADAKAKHLATLREIDKFDELLKHERKLEAIEAVRREEKEVEDLKSRTLAEKLE